LTLEV